MLLYGCESIMKTLFREASTFKSELAKTYQPLAGLQIPKLGDGGIARSLSAGCSWTVQTGRNSVRGRDESDLMTSQLG
jgi:hypothetical protein